MLCFTARLRELIRDAFPLSFRIHHHHPPILLPLSLPVFYTIWHLTITFSRVLPNYGGVALATITHVIFHSPSLEAYKID